MKYFLYAVLKVYKSKEINGCWSFFVVVTTLDGVEDLKNLL